MTKSVMIPIAELEDDALDHNSCIVNEDTCLVAAQQALISVNLDEGSVSWKRAQPQPAPRYYRVARRIHTVGRKMRTRGGVVAHLFETNRGSAIACYRTGTGEEIWRKEFPTPRPLSWTEATPAWEGAPTEEIEAFLADTGALVLAIHRRSRRSVKRPELTLPPRQSRLELIRLDWDTGEVLWKRAVDDVEISLDERDTIGLVGRSGDGVFIVDEEDGGLELVIPARKNQGWPRLVGGEVLAPWRQGGLVGIDSWSAGGLSSVEWKRKSARSTLLLGVGDAAFLRVNAQFLCGLAPEGNPKWEVRLKVGVDWVDVLRSGQVIVAGSGAGGGAYCLDPRDGSEVRAVTSFGPVWFASTLGKSDSVLLCCDGGIVRWTPKTGKSKLLSECLALFIAGKQRGKLVAVLPFFACKLLVLG